MPLFQIKTIPITLQKQKWIDEPFLIVIVFLGLLLSCSSDHNVGKLLKSFRKVEIHFPENMVCIRKGKVIEEKVPTSIPILVYYFDKKSCSDCEIVHLVELNNVYELSQQTRQFELLILFSPNQEEVGELVGKVVALQDMKTIFIDINGEFDNLNQAIPADQRFHVFLIDCSGHPIMVGAPTSSKRLYELFMKSLDRLQIR